jgi:hypothetical protein
LNLAPWLEKGDAGTLDAREVFTDRSGDAGLRRSERGKVRLAYGTAEWTLARGVIWSSASSEMLGISGDMVLEAVKKDSSLDEWRKGLLTRFGERIGLADRAVGRRFGEETPGSEFVRSIGAAVSSGLLWLECNRGGVAKATGELGKVGGDDFGGVPGRAWSIALYEVWRGVKDCGWGICSWPLSMAVSLGDSKRSCSMSRADNRAISCRSSRGCSGGVELEVLSSSGMGSGTGLICGEGKTGEEAMSADMISTWPESELVEWVSDKTKRWSPPERG